MRFDEHFVQGALTQVTIVNNAFPTEIHASIDTRTLQKGDVFFALSGTHCDGHDFLSDAISNGASGICIADDKRHLLDAIDVATQKKILIMTVPDTKHALIRLARVWRAQFDYPVIAITGSVGKTSTKELLSHVLSECDFKHMASYGNQNTTIGIALNMLKMRSYHKAAIFEVGINKRGQMAERVDVLRPTTAVITNVGHSHMEGLGSVADVALEKCDVFKFFTAESIGIINGDNPLIANIGYVHPVIKFGYKTTNQIQARKVTVSSNGLQFVLKVYKEKFKMSLDNVHEGFVSNILSVISITHLLEIPAKDVVVALHKPFTVSGRFEPRLLKDKKGILISDCYNANPESMKCALLAFEKMDVQMPKIAVLGDMLELGLNSPFWHRQLGRFLRKVPSLEQLILVGDMVQWTKKTAPVGLPVVQVATWKDAVALLQERVKDESCVLVKASNGIGLTNLVERVAEKK